MWIMMNIYVIKMKKKYTFDALSFLDYTPRLLLIQMKIKIKIKEK